MEAGSVNNQLKWILRKFYYFRNIKTWDYYINFIQFNDSPLQLLFSKNNYH